MIVVKGDAEERHSFWADSQDQEARIFERFLDVLGRYEDFRRVLLRRLRGGVPEADEEGGEAGQELVEGSCRRWSTCCPGLLPRLLPFLLQRAEGRGRLPGLPLDGAGRVGNPEHRLAARWEATRAEEWKQKLTTYNLEDCAALKQGDGVRPGHCSGRPPDALPDGEPRSAARGLGRELDKLAQTGSGDGSNFVHPDLRVHQQVGLFRLPDGKRSTSAPASLRKRSPEADEEPQRNLRVSPAKSRIVAGRAPSARARTRSVRSGRWARTGDRARRAFDLLITPAGIKRRVIECRPPVASVPRLRQDVPPERTMTGWTSTSTA